MGTPNTAIITTTSTTTITKRSSSRCLAKYIKTIQQANERTAREYEYRISKFEKYIAAVSEEEEEEQQLGQEQKFWKYFKLSRVRDKKIRRNG